MKQVIVESIVNLEDDDWEQLVMDVAEHMSKTWVPIESDDDLPDLEDNYLVTVRDRDGMKYQTVSKFYPDRQRERWEVETDGKTVLAWQTLLPY